MSSQPQPPIPPEIGTSNTRQSSDYIEIEIPVDDASPIAQRSNANCLWGCLGMMGCTLVFVGLLVGTVFLGAESVFNGFTNYFNLPQISIVFGNSGINIPDNVYIPPVERVQSLSDLTTTRYNYAEVIAGERDMPDWLSSLYGDSLALVAVGTVEAGIDVSEITSEDITYDELARILTITLPAPQLQSCFLDESQSYVVRRDTALFADPLDDLEDELRQRALLFYRDRAIEDGIFVDAESDVRATLSELLMILVNDETVSINILFEEPLLEPFIPDSCD